MKTVLFIDACLRGAEVSRTHGLCLHFLEQYRAIHPDVEIIHRDLGKEPFPLMTGELAAQRESWPEDHPLLAPAKEVARADLILVGAPFWDLSFPAALKAYLEWASCLGITFRYTQTGQQVGMSRAEHLIYCTTAGGPIAGQNYGYDYIRALAAMFGIESTFCASAEGLDILGSDVSGILEKTRGELAELAGKL